MAATPWSELLRQQLPAGSAVRFTAEGVEAHSLLAHGQRETALAGGARRAPVVRYARKRWLRIPFSEREIARDPGLVRFSLRP